MSVFSSRRDRHGETGWQSLALSYADAVSNKRISMAFYPEAGANLCSLSVDGMEYLTAFSGPATTSSVLGTPILFPTPNRVRDSELRFDGRTFRFPPNNGPNFLHGLVRDQAWQCDAPIVSKSAISVRTHYSTKPPSRAYELFPILNTIELTYTLDSDSLRFDFTIRNEDPLRRLPFGLAIHPYFAIFGEREDVRIQVPAQKWMESKELLPTGRLIDLSEGPADLRKPTPLTSLDLDDVFWGMEPKEPAVIYYDRIGKKLTLQASAFFTHSVVYTPPGKPYFCIENQSGSTDAHNLASQGFEDAAHLAILQPGESLSAWIMLQVQDQ